jgi:hypothetical protein
MAAAADDRERRRSSAAVSGPLLAALVATAVLGLVIYVTPPHLGSLGPDDLPLWVLSRVVWVSVALAVVTYAAVRFVRRGR